jgi:flotillin
LPSRLLYDHRQPTEDIALFKEDTTRSRLQHQFTNVKMWFHISDPNGYLVKTGLGIEKVDIQKKAFVWPFQKVTKLSITPFDFSMSLQAMTSEKLQFSLPAVFTIGPDDNVEALTRYAVLLTGDSDGQVKPRSGAVATGRNHVQEIVKGIIEGETRSIVSNMTMEELFAQRKMFKDQVGCDSRMPLYCV